MDVERRRRLRIRAVTVLPALVIGATIAVWLLTPSEEDVVPEPPASRWSLIEDHAALVRADARRREAVLDEMKELGADTIRVLARWHEIAPASRSRERPDFNATDPAAYPGFGPYDDLLRRAAGHGFRVLITLAPDAPRWATEERRPISPETVNLRPSAREFGDFAAALARRYSGQFRGLPAVRWFSIWNEPNHELFLKPTPDAPEIYRDLVTAALPRIRSEGVDDAQVLIGETASVGVVDRVMGPATFLRRLLCLDDGFRPLRGDASSAAGCRGFRGFNVDGFAHHPYGPAQRVVTKGDVINLLAIRRLGRYLDRAAGLGRLPSELPIFSTEFGLQSNPPDPTVGTSLDEQAARLNQLEERSYRYPRLRSFAQYLLLDDPARQGATPEEIWSGFQTGLRFHAGERKPAWEAWRLPIVVTSQGAGATVWGRVRPGKGTREVALERKEGQRFVREGERIPTDDEGYFEVRRPRATYRFRGFASVDGRLRAIGTSRTADPARAPVSER